MKKEFLTPSMKITAFTGEDILTASGDAQAMTQVQNEITATRRAELVVELLRFVY